MFENPTFNSSCQVFFEGLKTKIYFDWFLGSFTQLVAFLLIARFLSLSFHKTLITRLIRFIDFKYFRFNNYLSEKICSSLLFCGCLNTNERVLCEMIKKEETLLLKQYI